MGYSTAWMGWRPDLPDHRDSDYSFARALSDEIVNVQDLPPSSKPQRKELDKHPIRDQGPAGSCTGHGVGLIHAIERNVAQRSPLWIYAEARKMIGELDRDDGAYIRDAIKAVADLGAPHESKWPYRIERLHEEPPEISDRDAAKRKIHSYHRLDDDAGVVDRAQIYRSCLASGHLFTIGFSVYSSIDDPLVTNFGILPFPSGSFQGGHCVAVIGHDDRFRESEWAHWARSRGYPESKLPERVYECQNSWADDWGRKGRFVIDAIYLEHPYLADDAWTLRGFADERK